MDSLGPWICLVRLVGLFQIHGGSVLDLSWTGIVFPQKGHITPEDFSKCSALKWLILRNANLVGDDGVELSSQLEGSLHALLVLII